MTEGDFRRDVAVIGAGRIGLPWATVMASRHDRSVTCVDIDETVVANINRATPPFEEPQLGAYLEDAVESGNLEATPDPAVIPDHRYVAFTINAPRKRMDLFRKTVQEYSQYIGPEQVVVNRTTLPVGMVQTMREVLAEGSSEPQGFAVLPERLAEGNAIAEIEALPKVVGVDGDRSERALEELLDPFDCPLLFTDPQTAMFVKLIDNSYRDALFAIANQIAFTADQLELNAHEAISMANFEYPRNDIPTPGTVGGKCLPKDPHFLTDETVCEQPTTPDLFNSTRRTNASLQSYVATQILQKKPSTVAVLGLAYKRNVGDVSHSPAVQIGEILESHGVETCGFDPNVPDAGESLASCVAGADVVLLAVDHDEFRDIEPDLNEHGAPGASVYDVWNVLDPESLELAYDGLGLEE